ncbi:MAG: FtsH protease activity modulator HflK [Halieaceae bacterium]|jgi:membrane protease subunit HflK|nr:FtsH protease activity modulator HflK [Halieaceae bacterium]
MSWNEPNGGNGPRDPWGGKDQGPPDLDEALRKLQAQLNGFFGRGSGGSGGGSSKGMGGLVGIVAIVALTIWGLLGLTQIGEQERAVVLRLGEYSKTAQPGLFWYPRGIDTLTRVNITQVRSAQFRETMLTQDENIVDVSMSVQYVINDPINFVLEVRDPERSLQHAAQSALRHVVGDGTMALVLTEGRAEIAVKVRERLQLYLRNYTTGISVQKVNIDDASPPTQVQEAFDDVIKAREDEERVKNEAESYANGIVPEARGRAQRIEEEAEAYRQQVIAKATGEAKRFDQLLDEYSKAPKVTRERLYIDALESVLSKTNKVMVDVEGGNNVMYLPLDKMAPSAGSGVLPGAMSRGLTSQQLREVTDAVTEQLRRDLNGRNQRGGR